MDTTKNQIMFPSVPCTSPDDIKSWSSFFDSILKFSQNSALFNEVSNCIIKNYDCFAPPHNSSIPLNNNISQYNYPCYVNITKIFTGNDLDNLLSNIKCTNCITKTPDCIKYRHILIQISCFIKSLIQSNLHKSQDNTNIQNFIILLVDGCCKKKLSQSQKQKIKSTDFTSLVIQIQNIVKEYLSPDDVYNVSSKKSWFEKNKTLAIFLIVFLVSIFVVGIAFLIYRYSTKVSSSRLASRLGLSDTSSSSLSSSDISGSTDVDSISSSDDF